MTNENHTILGGKVHLYRRNGGEKWHCYTFLKGKKRRKTTKSDSLSLAKEIAEDWYIALRGKDRAGLIESDRTFKKAADQFIKEYEIITEGQRSERWVEGHQIRLCLHLIPFFGKEELTAITAGKVQDYRVHRATTSKTGKPPARSTLHDEIVTLRQVLKTAIRHGWLSRPFATLPNTRQDRSPALVQPGRIQTTL